MEIVVRRKLIRDNNGKLKGLKKIKIKMILISNLIPPIKNLPLWLPSPRANNYAS
jgi:hypothetical protein